MWPRTSKVTSNLRRALILVSALCLCTSAFGASFDCTKATTFAEIGICASDRLSALDDELAALYRAKMDSDEQQRWLREVRDACESDACIEEAYIARLEALRKSILRGAGVEKFRENAVSASGAINVPEQSSRSEKVASDTQNEGIVPPASSAVAAPQSVTHEARSASTEVREVQTATYSTNSTQSYFWWYVIGLVLSAMFLWNKFLRRRCPKCSSPNLTILDIVETDRWRGTKRVYEKNTRGTTTRHIQTTYVKNQYTYKCVACEWEWEALHKEEL
jgi:uncharacterized protein